MATSTKGPQGKLVWNLLVCVATTTIACLLSGCGSGKNACGGYETGTYESLEHWKEEHARAIDGYRRLQGAKGWEIISAGGISIKAYSSDLQMLRVIEEVKEGYCTAFAGASQDGRYLAYLIQRADLAYVLKVLDRESGASELVEVQWDPMNPAWTGGVWCGRGGAWSHGGSRLLLVRRDESAGLDELHVYDAATSEDRVLAGKDRISWVRWSPSDQAVAFRGEARTLWVLDAEKGSVRKVSHACGAYDWTDDDTLVVTERLLEGEGMLFLYSLSEGTSKELFAGNMPLSLAGERIAYCLDQGWYIASIDGSVRREIPPGEYAGADVVAISPCKRYLLVKREIRIKDWHGLLTETVVLDTNLRVCGATLEAPPGSCDWISRKPSNGTDN